MRCSGRATTVRDRRVRGRSAGRRWSTPRGSGGRLDAVVGHGPVVIAGRLHPAEPDRPSSGADRAVEPGGAGVACRQAAGPASTSSSAAGVMLRPVTIATSRAPGRSSRTRPARTAAVAAAPAPSVTMPRVEGEERASRRAARPRPPRPIRPRAARRSSTVTLPASTLPAMPSASVAPIGTSTTRPARTAALSATRRRRLDADDADVVALGRPQRAARHEPAAADRHDDRQRAVELRADLDARPCAGPR